MVGIGETDDEVLETLRDLRAAGVDVVTLGQYLRPTPKHARGRPLRRARARSPTSSRPAVEMGFLYVAVGAARAVELPRRRGVRPRDRLARPGGAGVRPTASRASRGECPSLGGAARDSSAPAAGALLAELARPPGASQQLTSSGARVRLATGSRNGEALGTLRVRKRSLRMPCCRLYARWRDRPRRAICCDRVARGLRSRRAVTGHGGSILAPAAARTARDRSSTRRLPSHGLRPDGGGAASKPSWRAPYLVANCGRASSTTTSAPRSSPSCSRPAAEAFSEAQLRALLADLADLARRTAPRSACRWSRSTITRPEQAQEVLRIAALMAEVSQGVSDVERGAACDRVRDGIPPRVRSGRLPSAPSIARKRLIRPRLARTTAAEQAHRRFYREESSTMWSPGSTSALEVDSLAPKGKPPNDMDGTDAHSPLDADARPASTDVVRVLRDDGIVAPEFDPHLSGRRGALALPRTW